jgi:hypothetical protein
MNAYHATRSVDASRRFTRGGRVAITAWLALGPLALSACAKGCTEGEAPLSVGTAPSGGGEQLVYASEASAPSSVARFLARRARASSLAFYRVSLTGEGASLDVAHGSAAAMMADIDAALRIDFYFVDEDTHVFAGREAEAPFPALSEDGGIRIAKEHQSALERFTGKLAVPASRRVLVGRSGDDEFAHTWVVLSPAWLGGESITQLAVSSEGGAWGVSLHVDGAARAKLDARAHEANAKTSRFVVAFDEQVRHAAPVSRALEGDRAFVTLGAGDAARAEGQSYQARWRSAARGSDLALRSPGARARED